VGAGPWATEAGVPYERDSIRPNVLGRFEDLLVAVAQSPAMLMYLDNWKSFKMEAGSSATRMNENYARELLELHTVGVENYTQQDVEEVARCFTGWTVSPTVGFYFEPLEHDTGSKVLGNLVIPAGGGMEDGLAVLHYLATRPETAHNIALKLARRFVSEDPPDGLVNKVANTFLDTDGDLLEVMRTIFHSDSFAKSSNFRTKVKRPFLYGVSTARALGTDTAGVVPRINDLTFWAGERFYRESSPTGFPDRSEVWLGVGAMIERVNFAHRAVKQASGFTFQWPLEDPGDDVVLLQELQDWLLLTPLSDQTQTAILAYGAAQPPGVMGDGRLEQLAYMILASPEFLLH
jgi:uncharacterized protein (DUF1800 family)